MEYLHVLKRVMLQQVVDQGAGLVVASPLRQLACHRVLVFLPVLEMAQQRCSLLPLGLLVGDLAVPSGHRVVPAPLGSTGFPDHLVLLYDLHGQLPQLLV